LSDAVDRAPAGRVMLVSLCAGQGHDVFGVVPDHPRRDDVRAVLVESDARNVVLARRAAARQRLPRAEVRQPHPGLLAALAAGLPGEVLLGGGRFGHGSVRATRGPVRAAPGRGRAGPTVIGTRHRRPPDLTPQIRAWFASAGFGEIAFDALETSALTSVGV